MARHTFKLTKNARIGAPQARLLRTAASHAIDVRAPLKLLLAEPSGVGREALLA